MISYYQFSQIFIQMNLTNFKIIFVNLLRIYYTSSTDHNFQERYKALIDYLFDGDIYTKFSMKFLDVLNEKHAFFSKIQISLISFGSSVEFLPLTFSGFGQIFVTKFYAFWFKPNSQVTGNKSKSKTWIMYSMLCCKLGILKSWQNSQEIW